MMRRLWLALLLAPVLLLSATEAEAARRVTWSTVEVRGGDDAKTVSRDLKKLLRRETRRAKWGKGKTVELSARVVKLHWETKDDVGRITVTVVAKIAGGKGARSHIRLGGSPKERRKLLRQALRIVSSGLVTRLSTMARGGGSS
jgi:hypothetical protein